MGTRTRTRQKGAAIRTAPTITEKQARIYALRFLAEQTMSTLHVSSDKLSYHENEMIKNQIEELRASILTWKKGLGDKEHYYPWDSPHVRDIPDAHR